MSRRNPTRSVTKTAHQTVSAARSRRPSHSYRRCRTSQLTSQSRRPCRPSPPSPRRVCFPPSSTWRVCRALVRSHSSSRRPLGRPRCTSDDISSTSKAPRLSSCRGSRRQSDSHSVGRRSSRIYAARPRAFDRISRPSTFWGRNRSGTTSSSILSQSPTRPRPTP